MTYNFDEPVCRRGTYSAKWDMTAALHPEWGDDFLAFQIADMDLRTAQPIVDAMHRVADWGTRRTRLRAGRLRLVCPPL